MRTHFMPVLLSLALSNSAFAGDAKEETCDGYHCISIVSLSCEVDGKSIYTEVEGVELDDPSLLEKLQAAVKIELEAMSDMDEAGKKEFAEKCVRQGQILQSESVLRTSPEFDQDGN